MTRRLYFDTETCGLTGPIVTIQTKVAGSEAEIYHVWDHSVDETLDYISEIVDSEPVAWNLPFDWFHLNKLFNLFIKLPASSKPDIRTVAKLEKHLVETNSHAEVCLKPASCKDLLLHARCGPLQSLMIPKKEQIYLRRIPATASVQLVKLLPQPHRDIPSIFFHYRGDASWQIEKTNDSQLVNLVLRFGPSMGLKPLIQHLGFDITPEKMPSWIHPPRGPRTFIPDLVEHYDYEFKPWGGPWPKYIEKAIHYWSKSEEAQRYATNDVIYLEQLDKFWGYPECTTNDHLACAVAAARWRGFSLDISAVKDAIEHYKAVSISAPTAPAAAKQYILAEAEDVFAEARLPDTKEKTLEQFNSERSRAVLEARRAANRLQTLRKLLAAKRFFPDFRVVGTKSNRMSGAGGLNAQGIPHESGFRKLFTFTEPSSECMLSAGDYSGFEVTIADAVYGDAQLRADISAGIKIHETFGQLLYDKDTLTAEEYGKAKNSVFAGIFYGGTEKKTAETAGVEESAAIKALRKMHGKYPGIKKARARIEQDFCSVKQPGGLGTGVLWADPKESVTSLLGFKRYYTFENSIIKSLFDLANSGMETFRGPDTIVRTASRGAQTIPGAIRSALYGAVFQLQARNLRTAANHEIQSTGAGICKELQNSLWQLQPNGINLWKIAVFNVHDEVHAIHHRSLTDEVNQTVKDHIYNYQKIIPLLRMEWRNDLKNWSEK